MSRSVLNASFILLQIYYYCVLSWSICKGETKGHIFQTSKSCFCQQRNNQSIQVYSITMLMKKWKTHLPIHSSNAIFMSPTFFATVITIWFVVVSARRSRKTTPKGWIDVEDGSCTLVICLCGLKWKVSASKTDNNLQVKLRLLSLVMESSTYMNIKIKCAYLWELLTEVTHLI